MSSDGSHLEETAGGLETYDDISRSLTFTKLSSEVVQRRKNNSISTEGKDSNVYSSDGFDSGSSTGAMQSDLNDDTGPSVINNNNATNELENYSTDFSQISENTSNRSKGEACLDFDQSTTRFSRAKHSNRSQGIESHSDSEQTTSRKNSNQSKSDIRADTYTQEFDADSDASLEKLKSSTLSSVAGYESDFEQEAVSNSQRSRYGETSSDSTRYYSDFEQFSDSDTRIATRSLTGRDFEHVPTASISTHSDSLTGTKGYASDFEHSTVSNTSTYSDTLTRTESYASDFESSSQSEDTRMDKATLNQQQLEHQLMYVNAMNKILLQSVCDNKGEQVIAAELRIRAAELEPVTEGFVSSSLRNIRTSEAAATAVESTSDERDDPIIQSSRRETLIPQEHYFYSRVEKLKIDNIITGMKQKSQQLCREIEDHNKFTRGTLLPNYVKNFVLPRKLQLERGNFAHNIETYEAEMNSVAMIGSIARDLPKLSDHPDVIWNQLVNTAQRRVTSSNAGDEGHSLEPG